MYSCFALHTDAFEKFSILLNEWGVKLRKGFVSKHFSILPLRTYHFGVFVISNSGNKQTILTLAKKVMFLVWVVCRLVSRIMAKVFA